MRHCFCVPWNWKITQLGLFGAVCLISQPFLSRLARAPSQVSPDDLNEIERYVVLLYQRTSSLSHVNEARKQLFAQNRKMENIPPTLHALEQHVKRSVYQARFNKIATQGAPQMTVDKEANSLSRVYSYYS